MMRSGPQNLILLGAAGVILLMLPCCQSLKPFEEIRGENPDSFVRVGTQQVHTERWGTSGPRVVLLHGFAASTYSFRDLGPRLGEKFRVQALDLNGFGFTERPKEVEGYRLDAQVELIRGVLGASENTGRVHLVGHSYGGLIAAEFARRHPELVGRLVLVSPAVEEGKLPWLMRAGITRAAGYPLVRLFLSSKKQFRKAFGQAFHREDIFSPEVSEAYRERLLVEGLWHAYNGFPRAMAGGERPVLYDPAEIAQPVLLLAGRHDQVVPLAALERFFERLPNARLEVLEQSGHSAPEEEPARVASLIGEFLLSPSVSGVRSRPVKE